MNRLGQKGQPKGSSGLLADIEEMTVGVLTEVKLSSSLPLLPSLRRLPGNPSTQSLLVGEGAVATGERESTSSEQLEVVDEGGVRQAGWCEFTDT